MSRMPENTVIIVAGPTAVGKTAFAIQLAQYFNTEIISADSRQCYREMSIGVAKPSLYELQIVKHHFIDDHPITAEVNAVAFEQYALNATEAIFRTHSVAVMVGGTGLYIKAFCEGLDAMPAIDPALRIQIMLQYEEEGIGWLQAQVEEKDPSFWEIAEQNNPQRLMRALEMVLQTGISITSFRQQKKQVRPFRIIKLGLELPREVLYERINNRVEDMMKQGLLQEVESLQAFRKLNALQTVGYKELFEHLDGKITLDAAVENIKKHTRHYAKRQMTWFKKDTEICWLQASDEKLLENAVSFI